MKEEEAVSAIHKNHALFLQMLSVTSDQVMLFFAHRSRISFELHS